MSAGRKEDPQELIEAALRAISERDLDRLERILHPEVEVRTDRSTHGGKDAALAWADKTYEHIDRHFAVEAVEVLGSDRYVVEGRVEYVWRESGEVGDSSPQAFAIELTGDQLRTLALHDDPEAARESLS